MSSPAPHRIVFANEKGGTGKSTTAVHIAIALAYRVSFVPGGLGGTELVMGSLLIVAGVDAPVAVSAVIICRLATLWFAVAIGLVAVVGIEIGGLGKKSLAGNTGVMEPGE